MTPDYHKGRCHCGSVVLGFSGNAITCYICHCTDCQKSSGTAFSSNMLAERKEITLLSGKTELIEYEFAERVMQRHHCCQCGTVLWLNYSDKSEYASIQTGIFESQEWFEPIAHLWFRSALSWVSVPADHTKFDTQPDLSELTELWQKSNNSAMR